LNTSYIIANFIKKVKFFCYKMPILWGFERISLSIGGNYFKKYNIGLKLQPITKDFLLEESVSFKHEYERCRVIILYNISQQYKKLKAK
ncbi:TPA: hypothetical protein ACHGQF_001817, partial [Campylobacter jejuni]